MKNALLCIAFVLCVLIGHTFSNQLNNRLKTLKAWRNAFVLLQGGMAHAKLSLLPALLYAGKEAQRLVIFHEKIKCAPFKSLESVFCEIKGEDCLLYEDECIIQSGIRSLALHTLKEQTSALQNTIDMLSNAIISVQEKRDKYSKMYFSLGVTVGLFWIILLI